VDTTERRFTVTKVTPKNLSTLTVLLPNHNYLRMWLPTFCQLELIADHIAARAPIEVTARMLGVQVAEYVAWQLWLDKYGSASPTPPAMPVAATEPACQAEMAFKPVPPVEPAKPPVNHFDIGGYVRKVEAASEI
jgi:hypothetical protein